MGSSVALTTEEGSNQISGELDRVHDDTLVSEKSEYQNSGSLDLPWWRSG